MAIPPFNLVMVRINALAGLSVLAVILMTGLPRRATASPSSAASEDIPPRIDFRISDLESGKTLFTGHETLRLEGTRTTKQTFYFTPSGQEAQKESIVYDLTDLKTLEYSLDHLPSGEQVRLRVDGDQINISYREKTGQPVTTRTDLRWKPGTIIGKSLHHIIARGWNKLQSGTALVFDLLVPFKQDVFAFKVRKVRSEEGLAVIRLMPKSWIVQKFVDDMDFYYSEVPPYKLVRYTGTSTIEVDGDRSSKVRIDFNY